MSKKNHGWVRGGQGQSHLGREGRCYSLTGKGRMKLIVTGWESMGSLIYNVGQTQRQTGILFE